MPSLGCCFLFITSAVVHFYSVKPRNLFLHAPGSYLEMGKGLEGESATEACFFFFKSLLTNISQASICKRSKSEVW